MTGRLRYYSVFKNKTARKVGAHGFHYLSILLAGDPFKNVFIAPQQVGFFVTSNDQASKGQSSLPPLKVGTHIRQFSGDVNSSSSFGGREDSPNCPGKFRLENRTLT